MVRRWSAWRQLLAGKGGGRGAGAGKWMDGGGWWMGYTEVPALAGARPENRAKQRKNRRIQKTRDVCSPNRNKGKGKASRITAHGAWLTALYIVRTYHVHAPCPGRGRGSVVCGLCFAESTSATGPRLAFPPLPPSALQRLQPPASSCWKICM
jgi:hypothetical protein